VLRFVGRSLRFRRKVDRSTTMVFARERDRDDRPATVFEVRGARTFKPRRRGLSAARLTRFHSSLDRWGLAEAGEQLDFRALFPDSSRVCIEIGSGNGDLASAYATEHPTDALIAIDVHRPGIARLLDDIERHGWSNLHVVEGDALLFVERLPDESVDELWAFFPDPWPKNSQAHRRLVSDDRIRKLARVIKRGGVLRLATDVTTYAEQMRRVVQGSGLFDSLSEERPRWRIETAFERTGRHAGRISVDLNCRRSQ
jgi:tRNA (guanine-N7-)-methyltransferase